MFKFTFQGSKGERLDQVLLEKLHEQEGLAGLTRSRLKQLIEAGSIRINSKSIGKAGYALKPGDTIEMEIEAAQSCSHNVLAPFPLELEILYEDSFLIVLNKPAGLTVHPGAGNQNRTLVNALVAYLGGENHFLSGQAKLLGNRPGIVHRLDKDTSGVIVIAKDPVTHESLSRQFARRLVTKHYIALAFTGEKGISPLSSQEQGVIDAKIARDSKLRTRMAVSGSGREAKSSWRVLERGACVTLVLVQPHTGRTHQIRVHMQYLKAPLVGDERYKGSVNLKTPWLEKAQRFGRQALHALRLEFEHPHSKQRMKFSAPWPLDFQKLLSDFGIRTKFEEMEEKI